MDKVKEKLVNLVTAYFGVDPAYYGIETQYFVDYLISHGVTLTSWIPVTDKLPEPLVDVLVYDSTGGRVELAFVTRHFEWVGVCMNHEVTHWMPVPEGPATLEKPEV